MNSERGQATVLFMFCIMGFAVLLVFVLNTGHLTTRRIEMQGSADAAAMAGAVHIARGMNLMALDNKGMSELLAVMVTVRATLTTARQMPGLLQPIIDFLEALPDPTAASKAMAIKLQAEASFWAKIVKLIDGVDRKINPPDDALGWQALRKLDQANREIKVHFLVALPEEVLRIAQANGANAAFALPGQDSLTPEFPVGRGASGYIAAESLRCCTDRFKDWAKDAIENLCKFYPGTLGTCVSPVMAWPILDSNVDSNLRSLSEGRVRPSIDRRIPADYLARLKHDGSTLQDILDSDNASRKNRDSNYADRTLSDVFHSIQIGFGDPIKWPRSQPPRPMILTGDPQDTADAEVPDGADTVKLAEVARYLKLLAVAQGSLQAAFGAKYFKNEAPLGLFTYGQTQVFNPRDWNLFDQGWQAKLVRADLLEQKWHIIANKAGIPSFEISEALSYANTH